MAEKQLGVAPVVTTDAATKAYVDNRSPAILVREVGDTTIPDDFPESGLVFTKQPLTLRKWDGVGLPNDTAITTSTAGDLDDVFDSVTATVTYTALATGTLWGMRSAPSGSTYRLDNWITKETP